MVEQLIGKHIKIYSTLLRLFGGSGNGTTTFNLPDLIGRVAWGSASAGTYLTAGLPNITGSSHHYVVSPNETYRKTEGAIKSNSPISIGGYGEQGEYRYTNINFDASESNSIYGSSSTVQPPAATLIPIIRYKL